MYYKIYNLFARALETGRKDNIMANGSKHLDAPEMCQQTSDVAASLLKCFQENCC
jgi:hypothetical protein